MISVFFNTKFDGILGMSYSSVAFNNVFTVFENIIAQYLLDEPVFFIYLNK